MSDIAQQGLKEPEKLDWENAFSGSTYVAPPPAIGVDGKYIVYYGIVLDAKETNPDEDYLNFLLDPIKLVKAGPFDGYQIRFTRASTKPYTVLDKATGQRVPKKGNPNALAEYLRACGMTAKPNLNSEYRAAVKLAQPKVFPFTVNWEAYNKDTGESIKGYNNFPDDQERPGQKKSILHAGDFVTIKDYKGNVLETKQVQSEVLFANARLRYFVDPNKGQKAVA